MTAEKGRRIVELAEDRVFHIDLLWSAYRTFCGRNSDVSYGIGELCVDCLEAFLEKHGAAVEKRVRAESDAQIAELREALKQINDIRNLVVGSQTAGWSSTIYPIVAALNAAGIEGMDYDDAKPMVPALRKRVRATEKANNEKIAAQRALTTTPTEPREGASE